MRTFLRRLGLAFGAMLFVCGAGIFIVAHDALNAIVAFDLLDSSTKDQVFKAFAGGLLLATLGAGLLAASMPRPRSIITAQSAPSLT